MKMVIFFLLYGAGGILQQLILTGLFFALGYDPVQGFMPEEKIVTVILYYGYAVYAVLALGYVKCVEKRSLKTMGLNAGIGSWFWGAGIAAVMLGVIIGIGCLTGVIIFEGCGNSGDFLYLAALAGGFLVQGAAEEMMCRGFLMTSLLKKGSLPRAIFWSATAFALPHFSALFAADLPYALVGVVNLYLISILFSLLMVRRKTIWISCGLHSVWNFLLAGIFGMALSGGEGEKDALLHFAVTKASLWNGGAYGIEAGLLTTAALGVGILLLTGVGKLKAAMQSSKGEERNGIQ